MVTLREYVLDLTRRIDWRVGREMIPSPGPGSSAALAFYALGLLDRFFVKHYHGLADTGLYGVAFRYSQVVVVAVLAFRMGWTPWHYPWLRSGRHHADGRARSALYYFFATGFLAVARLGLDRCPCSTCSCPSATGMPRRRSRRSRSRRSISGAYTIFAVGFNVTKRMRLLAPLALFGGAIAVGLYFLLIPPFSFVGAAWATAAAFACLALLVLAVSNRIYPVPWDWRRIGLAAGADGRSRAALARGRLVAVGCRLDSGAARHHPRLPAAALRARLLPAERPPRSALAVPQGPAPGLSSERRRCRR